MSNLSNPSLQPRRSNLFLPLPFTLCLSLTFCLQLLCFSENVLLSTMSHFAKGTDKNTYDLLLDCSVYWCYDSGTVVHRVNNRGQNTDCYIWSRKIAEHPHFCSGREQITVFGFRRNFNYQALKSENPRSERKKNNFSKNLELSNQVMNYTYIYS